MNIIDRVKHILITPKTGWIFFSSEDQALSVVMMSYVLPLALIGAVAAFIGFGFIGMDTGFLGIRVKGINWGLYNAIRSFISAVLSILISAFVVDTLASSFGSEKNLNRSVQLVAYACTPGLIGAFLNILPALAIIGSLIGLYGIYLWYLGLEPMKKTPNDKKVIYLIISMLVCFVVFVLIRLIVGKILGTIFGFGAMGEYGRFGI